MLSLRTAEHEHILAGFLLRRVLTELALEHARMRRVDDHQLFQTVGVRHCKGPSDCAAPVVRHQNELLVTELFRECSQVFNQVFDLILLDLARF